MTSVISKKTNVTESEDIDLARIVGEFIDHRKLILSVTSICTMLAIVYALFATPIYQANSLLQIEQKQGNALLDSLSQVLPNTQPQSAPEIALLQSRMILGKTVDDLNLQAEIEQQYFPIFGKGWARLMGNKPGKIAISHIYLTKKNNNEAPEIEIKIIDNKNYLISGDDFQIKAKAGELIDSNGVTLLIDSIDAEPDTKFQITYLSKLKAINNLLKNFSVADQGRDTGILNLTLTGDDPENIAKILDSISNNYLTQNIERQAAQDAKSLEFLNVQLPKVRSDLDLAENKLNEYRRTKDTVDLSMEAKSVLDQIVNVDSQLNELTFREAEISQLYTKAHPTYKALIEKRETLTQEKNRLNKRVSSMPTTQQEVLRLSRDVESGRAVYMMLLNRQQELNIAKSSAIGNVRIIDHAVTDPKPVRPGSILVVVIGFVIGLVFSSAIVILRIFLRRGIESPEQLEELGINVYASIPISEWMAKANINENKNKNKNNQKYSFLALDNPADLAIEAIRSLRTSLHFAMLEERNNILMISGASPSAGKSFVSSNLSAVVVQGGKRVLFIDCDMRKGYLHKVFNVSNDIGMSDILSGKNQFSSAVKHLEPEGFHFIPRGQVPPNPAELLMSKRCGEFLDWASKEYDLIVIDTPPILAVTDAAILGRYVGTTLIVARFEANTAKEIDVSIKKFEQSGVQVKGCILNGVVKKASNYYGYGYSSYGYSYKDDTK
ncbi:TPA: polysaccharide biosynthesis tyrosine autokinase [Klebsiella pneumoniae]|nr:polysaccharide biosynthesis tyrosine autokinase [Klebsiella pneumoniae]